MVRHIRTEDVKTYRPMRVLLNTLNLPQRGYVSKNDQTQLWVGNPCAEIIPRVATLSQPWAMRRNPVGIQ